MGLRETKKERTRQALSDTATGLFMKRGFDHVTVAEVAEAAGVSEKTVFNYFPTKEDLLFDELPEREEVMRRAVRERRPGEPVLETLRRSHLAEVPRYASPGFARFARVIEESPALLVKELQVMARLTEVLAEALAEELDLDELEARYAASFVMGAYAEFFALARRRALAGRHGPAAARRLRADLNRAYELLERGLGKLA